MQRTWPPNGAIVTEIASYSFRRVERMASCLQLVVILALAGPCFGYLFPAFKKCYGDLGCFAIDGDFVKRPVQLLPSSPEKLRTQFLLNTR